MYLCAGAADSRDFELAWIEGMMLVFIRGSVPDSIPCDLILGISQNELDFVTDLFSKFQFM